MARNNALTFNLSGIQRMSDRVGRVISTYDRASDLALAGLKRRAVPAAKRAIAANFNVAQSKIVDRTGGPGVRVETSKNRLSLWASTQGIPLISFGGRWKGTKTPGATASIERGEPKVYGGAFIATVKGSKQIYVRKRGPNGKRFPRGPLRRRRGPSPFNMIAPTDNVGAALNVQRTVLAELTEFYISELVRQLERKS